MIYAFIGLGNMASAIIRGMHKSGLFAAKSLYGHDISIDKMQQLEEETGLIPCPSNQEAVQQADVVVLAVKPQMLDTVLTEISPALHGDKLLISIAAGKPLDWYQRYLPDNTPLIRVMPNINARVGAASSALCGNAQITEQQMHIAEALFHTVGETYRMEEKMFSAFTAICGSAVAFAFMYIDALASAGVKAGFSRELATQLAIQSTAGCMQLLAIEGSHPMQVVDQICSPAGTTIEGVHKLRELGFENCIYQGIQAITDKDKAMGQ